MQPSQILPIWLGRGFCAHKPTTHQLSGGGGGISIIDGQPQTQLTFICGK